MILIVNHSNDYSLLKDIHFYVYHKTFYKGKAFPSGAFSLFEIENKKNKEHNHLQTVNKKRITS